MMHGDILRVNPEDVDAHRSPHAAHCVDPEGRQTLEQWARRPTTAQGLAQRARLSLACVTSKTNGDIAVGAGVTRQTVGRWRHRLARKRLAGLMDEPRPGAPRKITDAEIERVIALTLESMPRDATHWSTRGMAKRSGLSQTAISRIWRTFGLQPHRSETCKLSRTRCSSIKYATWLGCISTRRTRRWGCAWTKSLRSRRLAAPSPCCRCDRARSNDARPTTLDTASPRS